MLFMRKACLSITVLFFSFTAGYSQTKKIEFGGKLINELAYWQYYAPGLGLQVIRHFTTHSGMETGVYFKTKPETYLVSHAPSLYPANEKVVGKTIVLPLLYRFESFKINFTAGIEIDYLINKKNIEANHTIPYGAPNPLRNEVISSISVSKTIYLKGGIVIEPELRGRAFIPRGGGGLSLNFAIRKRQSHAMF
jgi:hypothetical protein